MKVKATTMIKYHGSYFPPGDVIDIKEKTIVKRLLGIGAAEAWAETPDDGGDNDGTPDIEALMKIRGVNQKMAKILAENAVLDAEDVVELGVEGLAALKGIGKSGAEKIHAAAVELTGDPDEDDDSDYEGDDSDELDDDGFDHLPGGEE